MNKEFDAMVGQQNPKRELEPKLRFPEFRNAGNWENEPMDKLYTFRGTYALSRDKLNYKRGLVKIIHYGDIHTTFSSFFDIQNERVPYVNPSESLETVSLDNYGIEGDMIFADASEDLDDIGKSIEIVKLHNERLLSGLHTLLARQKDNSLVIGFGGYLFQSIRIRNQIKRESQGTKVLGVSAGRLSKIEICYPSNKEEQQKIVDCLFSVNELIIAEASKLDVLKAYKKGLLQQLFPTEGETVPRLRFPEFRDAGAWMRKKISQTADIYKGKGISKSDIVVDGYQPCIRYGELYTLYGEVIDNVISKTNLPASALFLSKKNDVIIPASGETKIDIATASCVTQDNIALGGDLNIIRSSLNGVFLSYYLNSALRNDIAKIAQGDTVVHLYPTQLELLDIAIPSGQEQKKIADCLSLLDNLIDTQSQKINTLKVHKKGLMQQLFPMPDEVKE